MSEAVSKFKTEKLPELCWETEQKSEVNIKITPETKCWYKTKLML